MSSLADQIHESTVRIAAMWPMIGLTDEPSQEFREAVEYLDLPDELTKYMPEYSHDHTDIDDIDWEETYCRMALAGEAGWLVLAHVPVFSPSDGRGASFSWGHYNHRLFYSKTADGAIATAIAWARSKWDDAIAQGGAS